MYCTKLNPFIHTHIYTPMICLIHYVLLMLNINQDIWAKKKKKLFEVPTQNLLSFLAAAALGWRNAAHFSGATHNQSVSTPEYKATLHPARGAEENFTCILNCAAATMFPDNSIKITQTKWRWMKMPHHTRWTGAD